MVVLLKCLIIYCIVSLRLEKMSAPDRDWSWAPFQEEEDEKERTLAQLVGFDAPSDETDDTGFDWLSDAAKTIAAQRTGYRDLSRDEVTKLKERGFHPTENLGEEGGGEVFKAYTHPDVVFEVPVEPGGGELGWHASYVRTEPIKLINLGNKACAIKRVREGFFDKELETMLLLNHPNCVKFYGTVGYGKGNNRVNYLVMEFLNGRKDFSDYIYKFIPSFMNMNAKRLDEWTARLIIKHLVLGVQYLHSRGIVHYDLHSGNFMPHCENGRMIWKLIDFGLAKIKGDPEFQYDNDFNSLIYIIQKVVDNAGMDENTASTIRNVIDNITLTREKLKTNQPIDANDMDTMEKVVQALSPLFPTEDDPPEGSAALEFCKEYEQ